MKNTIPDKLMQIRLQSMDSIERDRVWDAVLARKTQRPLLAFLHFTHMTGILVALLIILGGGGIVAASDNAKPGDALYGVDLAAERTRLALAGETKKNDLAVRFANERLVEVQKLRGDGSADDSNGKAENGEAVTEIEADIFTNETVIKIEINDEKYGFVTPVRTREAIVAQIAGKYHLDKDFVDARISIETEDRASRAEDKEFIPGTAPVTLTDKQKRDIDTSFTQSITGLGSDNAQLVAALTALMQSSDKGKLKFEQNGQEIEIESEDGVIKIEVKDDSKDDDDKDDDSRSGKDDSQDTDEDNDSSSDRSGKDDDSEDDKNDDDDKDDDSKEGTSGRN